MSKTFRAEYRENIDKEDFEKANRKIKDYFNNNDWYDEFANSHLKEQFRDNLYFKEDTCVLNKSYKQSFHPYDRPNPKGRINLLMFSSNEKKLKSLEENIQLLIKEFTPDL